MPSTKANSVQSSGPSHCMARSDPSQRVFRAGDPSQPRLRAGDPAGFKGFQLTLKSSRGWVHGCDRARSRLRQTWAPKKTKNHFSTAGDARHFYLGAVFSWKRAVDEHVHSESCGARLGVTGFQHRFTGSDDLRNVPLRVALAVPRGSTRRSTATSRSERFCPDSVSTDYGVPTCCEAAFGTRTKENQASCWASTGVWPRGRDYRQCTGMLGRCWLAVGTRIQ